MQKRGHVGRRWRLGGVGVLIGMAALVLAVGPAWATSYTLTDLNSVAELCVTPSGTAGAPGVMSWNVDGVNQIKRQWFWFRIGNTAAETPLDNLTLMRTKQNDNTDEDGIDSLTLTYQGQGLKATILYQLNGAAFGSRESVINETITLTNVGSSTLDLHFFQYTDANLGDSAGNDVLSMMNRNTILQTGSGSDHTLMETVVTPAATYYDLASASFLYGEMTDSAATTLGDHGSTVAGDVAWAYQWDFQLTPNGSFSIGEADRIGHAPEPLTMTALFAAVAGLGAYVRKRKMQG